MTFRILPGLRQKEYDSWVTGGALRTMLTFVPSSKNGVALKVTCIFSLTRI